MGTMATDFYWSHTDEPHACRRKQILLQYPQIKHLFCPDPWAFLKITVVVLLQLWTSTFLYNASWLKILMVAYFFGSFLNHNLFLVIHELSHNLAFSTPIYNRWLGIWEFINLTIQLALDAAMIYFWGWKSFGYMILSTFVGGGMHPMAGHFISKHYVFNDKQETYSYYGPLNLVAWNLGYHNEHHDFPRIPGSKLHKVKEIAPEYYENLDSYSSWSQVIFMYEMDCTIGPFSRMKRTLSTKNTQKCD